MEADSVARLQQCQLNQPRISAAFRRLTLAPGESRRVELTVGPKQLRTLGSDYVWRVEPGKFELQLGDNAENILLRADLTVE